MLKDKRFHFSYHEDTIWGDIKYLWNDLNGNPVYRYTQSAINIFWRNREYIQYHPKDKKWYYSAHFLDKPEGDEKVKDPFDVVDFDIWPGKRDNELAHMTKRVFDKMREIHQYVDGKKHPKYMVILLLCNKCSRLPNLPLEMLFEIVSFLKVGEIDNRICYEVKMNPK